MSGQNNLKGVHGEKLRTPGRSQQPVLGAKEIPRAGSCELVESHHCIYACKVSKVSHYLTLAGQQPSFNKTTTCGPQMLMSGPVVLLRLQK